MKVAILTQPLHTNYGGTLQAYALQKVLINLGHEPETINYRSKIKRPLFIRVVLSKIKRIVLCRKITFDFTTQDRINIRKHHQSFIDTRLNYSEEINGTEGLRDYILKNNYGAVIIGSDQTWRPIYSPRIDSFFLDFLSDVNDIKKMAYAASFGTDKWEFTESQTNLFKLLLSKFDYVSVRESSGVKLCSEKFGLKAELVLDPTLLLTFEDYTHLLDNDYINLHKGKVFSYVLDENYDKKNFIDTVASTLRTTSFYTYPKKITKDEYVIRNYSEYEYPPIEYWISSFKAAEFIVTDSFHGTVFSIIFNKPFIAIANEERGKARFTSLLEMFGLERRLVSNLNDVDLKLVNEKINYGPINEKIAYFREECLKKLQLMLIK